MKEFDNTIRNVDKMTLQVFFNTEFAKCSNQIRYKVIKGLFWTSRAKLSEVVKQLLNVVTKTKGNLMLYIDTESVDKL